MEFPTDSDAFLSNVCFDCWRCILFPSIYYNGSDIDAIVNHPELQRRYAQTLNSDSLDSVCDFCRCKTLKGDLLIDTSLHFREDTGLLSIGFETIDLDAKILNEFEKCLGKTSISSDSFDDSRILKGFNFSVLAVHLLRISSPEKKHLLPGFVKNTISVYLTENFKATAEEKWTPFAKSYFENRNVILAQLSQNDSDDDLSLKIESHAVTKMDGFKFQLLNVLKERLKYLLVDSLVIVCNEFKEKYSNLFNWMANVSNDKLLFEQLLRMTMSACFTLNGIAKIDTLSLCRNVITFMGCYNKYATGISQTVWMLNKEHKAPTSIEECIGLPFIKVVLGEEYKFMASGREDSDVRTIGKGRDFCLEIYNCKRDVFDVIRIIIGLERNLQESSAASKCIFTKFPTVSFPSEVLKSTCAEKSVRYDETAAENGRQALDYKSVSVATTAAEKEKFYIIDNFTSGDVVTNHDLQVRCCYNGDLKSLFYNLDGCNRVSFSVEFWDLALSFKNRFIRKCVHVASTSHTKTYECLVYSRDALDTCNIESLLGCPFDIIQSNPMRTSHRKSLKKRTRTIFEISASLLHPRLVFVRLKSQAGTYIKEFVSGDFGRTRPSLADLLGSSCCKVLRLDVIHFD